MLVLIVVAASIAFAAFVASYQSQYQAQQAESQQRSLESLRVLDITNVNPQVSPDQLEIQNFSFILASEYVHTSQIASIAINGNPLAHFLVTNVSPAGGTPECYDDSMMLNLSAFSQVEITVNTNAALSTPCAFGFFDPSTVVYVDSFLQTQIFTILQNTFTSDFLPPTAVPAVSSELVYSGMSYQDVPLLDGSASFQTGNGTLTSWSWTVTNTSAGAVAPLTKTTTGEKATFPFLSTFHGQVYTYNITLAVSDSSGLLGVATFPWTYDT